MKAHNVFERFASLIQEGKPNHNIAEQLDMELIRASQHAENKCRHRPLAYWSIELHQQNEKLSEYGQLRRRLKRDCRYQHYNQAPRKEAHQFTNNQ